MSELSQRLTAALTGRYRIERELRRGGMATVFLAHDLKHDRRVALKVLDPEVAADIGPERFLREIRTTANLTHPHVLPLHDSGVADGLLFYVMPFVEGESLHDRLAREKQLSIEEALRIAREVADALDYAHQQGVVHRDIKPGNILLEGGHAVVADFGIAKAAAPGGAGQTTTGVMVGTPAYMSPEQATGSRDLDGRTDQYSLACVVYEMLAGVPPFAGPTAQSLIHQHLNAAPRPVTEVRAGVPAGVTAALTRALAKTPADRYATTGEFAAALGAEEAKAPERRAPAALWAPAAAVGLVVALSAVAAWQGWWPFPGKAGPPPARKDWILVADFDGPPGDSTLAPAARSLLSAALDQSRIVATVPGDQIRQALRLAGKPPGTRVTAELARELAYRSAVRAVLEGTIGRLGRGYTIVARVLDADTARVLVTRSATAKDDDALVPAIGRLGTELRLGLGENRVALAATRSMTMIATPSFEAYRLFVQAGQRYSRQIGNRELLRNYQAALALDPGFASARLAMWAPYANLGYFDSARTCLVEALGHPDRLSPIQRQRGEIFLASLDGDLDRAVAAWDRILADDPTNVGALASCNDDLWAVGRFQDALDRTRRAMQLSPFGPNEVHRVNEVAGLTALGRLDEARDANRRQVGVSKVSQAFGIEVVAGRYAVAESLARLNPDDPRLTDDAPEGHWAEIGMARFARGGLAEASDALRTAIEHLTRRQDPFGVFWYPRMWTELWVVSKGTLVSPPLVAARDTSVRSIVTRGLQAVAMGKRDEARRCLDVLLRHPPRDLSRDRLAVPLIQARLAALTGRHDEAVRLLRPFAFSSPVLGASLTWARWWMADAYEQMGRADSAAWWLERGGPGAGFGWDPCERPYVDRRLALLDARLGRVPEAERHLAAAEQAWDRPDPDVRRMLDEARAAVRAGRAMTRPRI